MDVQSPGRGQDEGRPAAKFAGPIATATLRGVAVPVYRSPRAGADAPWFSAELALAAFGFDPVQRAAYLDAAGFDSARVVETRNGPEWLLSSISLVDALRRIGGELVGALPDVFDGASRAVAVMADGMHASDADAFIALVAARIRQAQPDGAASCRDH